MMADINSLISTGIGSPAGVKYLIWFGLSQGTPATALTSLTVQSRGTGMTVRDREESLTVQSRGTGMTVRDREESLTVQDREESLTVRDR